MEAITNSAGAVVVRESFDAFGKRRGSNWQGAPSSADMTAIGDATRRGYTQHSMLDNLGLVHMNGRVQDPLLGRFLSADPFIDGELDTQGWNRYSYVQNNPLSHWDPSGYGRTTVDRDSQQPTIVNGMQQLSVSTNRSSRGATFMTSFAASVTGYINTRSESGGLHAGSQRITNGMNGPGPTQARSSAGSGSENCNSSSLCTESGWASDEREVFYSYSTEAGFGAVEKLTPEEFAGKVAADAAVRDTIIEVVDTATNAPTPAGAIKKLGAKAGQGLLAKLRGIFTGRGSFKAAASENLRGLGLEGVDLAGRSYNSGRKALESSGFRHVGTTSTGRQVFENSGTGSRVTYDSGRALGAGQSPHWTVQDRGGNFYDRSGRPVAGPSPPMGGKHIPGG